MSITPELHFEYYIKQVERYLKKRIVVQQPRSLYNPCHYVFRGGGKRLRPVLLMLSCEAVGGKSTDAISAGAAIEILHNFTLVHDDIMDHAPSRRGRPTVHKKWDESTAILVGDVLLALAYRELLSTPTPDIQKISQIFTEAVVTVCEGQALDKEFESRTRVYVNEYIMMIEKKTGKLFSASTEIGATIGGGTKTQVQALSNYGAHLGRAFQIQDDLLDVIGDEGTFGKAIGGDLQEGKRTYLLLEAMRRAKGNERKALEKVFARKVTRKEIDKYRKIYEDTGAINSAKERIQEDLETAKERLFILPETPARQMLIWLTEKVLNRSY